MSFPPFCRFPFNFRKNEGNRQTGRDIGEGGTEGRWEWKTVAEEEQRMKERAISLPPLIKHTADNMANSVSSQAMCFKERAKLKIVAVRGPKPPCCNSSRFNHVPLANWIMSFSGLYRLLIRNICNTTVKYCQPRHHVNYSHVGQPTDSYRS